MVKRHLPDRRTAVQNDGMPMVYLGTLMIALASEPGHDLVGYPLHAGEKSRILGLYSQRLPLVEGFDDLAIKR